MSLLFDYFQVLVWLSIIDYFMETHIFHKIDLTLKSLNVTRVLISLIIYKVYPVTTDDINVKRGDFFISILMDTFFLVFYFTRLLYCYLYTIHYCHLSIP